MRKSIWAGVLGLGAAAGGIYTARRHLLAQMLHLPPPRNSVRLQRNIRLSMPDGVALATDVYRPGNAGTHPTILIRTPYGRGGRTGFVSGFIAQRFAERGYNVVCQDMRGRFDSEGEFEPYVHEASDGRATLDWIAQQPWANDEVGMWGQSYVGYAQWAAASTNPPNLKALVPVITHSNLGPAFDHGYLLDRTLRWLLILDALGNPDLAWRERTARATNARVQDRLLADAFTHLPLATVDEAALGRSVPFYQTWMQHLQPDDPYWQAADYRASVPQIAAKTHLVGGWYDIFLPGTLDDYTALHDAGRTPQLSIGPWTHLDLGGMLDSVRIGLRWFDATLRGATQPVTKPVRLYVMGANEWREFDSWPPPAHTTAFFLQAQAALATNEPSADAAPDQYRYDPADPTPNLGGPLLASSAGAHDNRPLEARDDVLCYTTAPLSQALEVIGPVRLVLYVRSSLEHTDFFGRLCDVHPDGRSINICDGLFRIEPGRGTPQPDGSLHIEIDLWATAHRFGAGHRVRVQVSSGAHPRIARNLGTGEPLMHGTTMLAAEQTIFHDAERPSHLLLPVYDGV